MSSTAPLSSWVLPELAKNAPLNLHDLRGAYDSVVAQIARSTEENFRSDPSVLWNAQLICRLLLLLCQHDNSIMTAEQKLVMETTLYRSKMLLSCLGDDSVPEEDSLLLQVRTRRDSVHHRLIDFTWTWTTSNSEPHIPNLADMDREVLAHEADLLSAIAATPTPEENKY